MRSHNHEDHPGARSAKFPMALTAFALLLTATLAFAGEVAWKDQSGQFATFQTPAAMIRDSSRRASDAISEAYRSPDLILTFDSETRSLPPSLQKQFDRTVTTWVAQRKKDWRKPTFVEGGGGIDGSDNPKDPSGMRYYLFLNCALGESDSFGVHVHFRNLDRLDDVERILKSIKFKIH